MEGTVVIVIYRIWVNKSDRVLGQNDSNGRWDGILPVIPIPPAFQRFYLQVGSAHLRTGALALADISTIMFPPVAPPAVPASRIASGSDRDAVTGGVSFAVPVTLSFSGRTQP